MYQYYLSLGSNIENEYLNITQALNWLKKIKSTKLKLSNYYITAPQNMENQRDFLNVCVYMDSELNPFKFLAEIKKIECIIGRKPTARWGPRVIDIDIIWVRGIKMSTNSLTIPHPRAFQRSFVLTPLKELVTADNELKKLIEYSEPFVKDQRIEFVTEFKLKHM